MKISKYTKLGILVTASLTILIWGLSYLKGNDIFSGNNYYYVVYNRIDGLQESNKVIVNGFPVGQVKSIQLAGDRSGRLIVKLMMDASFEVPVNSVAQIVSSDIMGTRSIRMILSDEKEIYQPNDTIPGAVEADLKEQVSLQVLPIKNKAEQLLSTLDSAITALTVILNEDARKNLAESFENINQTFDNIEQTTNDLQEIVSSQKGNIRNILSNIEDITDTLRNNTGHLQNTLVNISALSDTLSQLSFSPVLTNIEEISRNLLAVLDKLNQTDNTAGLLLNDKDLYESVTALSENLRFLINDIQTNPKRYLQFSALNFGKEYYINTSGDATSKNIIFKVHLISTENRIPLNSSLFVGLGEIEEYEVSGAYSYLVGATSSYAEIMDLQKKARLKFPEASVVAFKNGRLIKLEKALKNLK